MKKELFEKALGKIPMVVAQMANWNTNMEYWKLEVIRYNKWGTTSVFDRQCLEKEDMMDHLQMAKKRGYTIDSDETAIHVRRDLPDGEHLIATYTPLVDADGTVYET